MKKIFVLFMLAIFGLTLYAQDDTTEVKVVRKNVVTVIEDGKSTQVRVGEGRGVDVITDEMGDTTQIRVGRRIFKVIEDDTRTYLNIEKEPYNRHQTSKFNPHWAGLEFGINMFSHTNYSIYQQQGIDPVDFMELHQGKSITVNLNIGEWAFTNESRTFGIVTGIGFSFMDFTFDRPISIKKREGDGLLIPVDLDPAGLRKSKLSVSYLTAPLMLEVKTPLRMGNSNLYLAGGVIGGLNIGSHTKYKYKNNKEKSRSNFNLNQFKYDLTGRIGFGDFCVFVNYGMMPLFKENRGPELNPVTIGISFPNI